MRESLFKLDPDDHDIEGTLTRPFAEFSGRIKAVDYAEIRPQVSGRITEIHFHDGEHVSAGDVLFVIDPRPYQAAVDKAQADLTTAINNAAFAKAERERGSQLVKSSTLSQETFDQRVNSDEVAKAAAQSAHAALESAQINLDYAYVKAPISKAERERGSQLVSGDGSISAICWISPRVPGGQLPNGIERI